MKTPFLLSSNASDAYAHAIRYGWMCGEQYRLILEYVQVGNSSLLVFGMGHDSILWATSVAGELAFVEEDPTYLTAAPAGSGILHYQFPSRVGVWAGVPEVPSAIARRWDCVLVDGPTGFSLACAGRQIPIDWARQLAQRQIFVHDYERPWEREVCDRLLGSPHCVVRPSPPKRGTLAVFDCKSLIRTH